MSGNRNFQNQVDPEATPLDIDSLRLLLFPLLRSCKTIV